MPTEEVIEQDLNLDFPPKVGQVVNGYQLEDSLKTNKLCVVHVCHHISDVNTKYVTKIGIKWEAKKLSNEIKCYEQLSGGEGIPRLIFNKSWTQDKEEWNEIRWAMIVIEKLVPKFEKTSNRFSNVTLTLEELVPLAIQQISSFEFIHSRGYIHKGVKPDNFVLSEDGSKVYLIDFNKSKRYLDSKGQHIGLQKDYKPPKGLPLFHSLNYHNGIRCSRRDDMESLGYCWLYLLRGKLPWSDIKNQKDWNRYLSDIYECLKNTSFEQLCEGFPTNAKINFIEYFKLCRKLDFEEKPDYELMRRLIANSLSDSTNN